MSQSFNFGEWVRRLRWARTDSPPILFEVQPMLLVGDHRHLTPHYQGPGMLMGGNSGNFAGEHSVMEFFAGSPGGMLIHELRMTGTIVALGILTAEAVWGSVGPVELLRDAVIQPTPAVTGRTGTVTPANRRLASPGRRPQSADPYVSTRDIYVRNGLFFVMEASGVNDGFAGWALIEELPAEGHVPA